jgi:hypothetical protein
MPSVSIRNALAFAAGAAAAAVAADALLIAAGPHAPAQGGVLHHVEFLATFIVLVALSGSIGIALPAPRALRVPTCVALGAIAALLGYGASVALLPAVGPTAALLVLAVASAGVPLVARHWPGGR